MVYVRPPATALAVEHFVAAVSAAQPQNAASAAGFSTATIASPSAGRPRCNTAPSDVLADTAYRIPSTSRLVVAALAVGSVAFCMAVAFSVGLTDLDRGSWERSLPEGSSLGGDCTPLRGAYLNASGG
jgi:hypothetical protein